MRLFYAAFLSSEHMDFYRSLVSNVALAVPDVLRPVPDDSHHLTLAFLGEVDDRDSATYLDLLGFAERFPSFPFSLGQPRILFSRRSPRLVCVDLINGGERVTMLQKLLSTELRRTIPASAVRPKPPHVTLARFRKNANREAARKVAESFARLDGSAPGQRTDRLASVHLVKSKLTPQGPVYQSLGQALLAPA